MSDDPRGQRARDAVECDDLGMVMADDFDWRELVRALLAVVGKQRDDWVGLSMDVADLECQLSTTEAERDELRAKLDELTPTDPTLCPTCGCHEREWVEGCQCPDRSCGCWEVRQETDQ